MGNTKLIADQINNFDFYYEMSDDTSKFDKGTRVEKEIKDQLAGMNADQLTEVMENVTVSQESVDRYFKDSFTK